MTAAGIDVGKATLDLAVDGIHSVRRFANSPAGIGKLISHLQGVVDPHVVVDHLKDPDYLLTL